MSGKVLRRRACRRPCPDNRYLHRVHQRQRIAVLRIAEHDYPLDEREPEPAHVMREVRVSLCREVWFAKLQQARFDMKAPVSRVYAEDSWRCNLPFRV